MPSWNEGCRRSGKRHFEAVQDIVGYTNLCYIKCDDEELFADLFKAMGDVHYKIWSRFMDEFSDVFCVMRFGDDLGFKSSTLLSPDDIRTHILPQYRRITDLVHSKGKPFLLHSCGNLFEIFDDIIEIANIDAKHSNEDEIGHFTVWVERYGDRIANFGGIDTDVYAGTLPITSGNMLQIAGTGSKGTEELHSAQATPYRIMFRPKATWL